MKLYSSSQIEWLKSNLVFLLNICTIDRVIQVLIIFLFYILWFDFIDSTYLFINGFLFIPIGVLLPFILLIAILKFESHISYFIVISIFLLSLPIRIEKFIKYRKIFLYDEWSGTTPVESLMNSAETSIYLTIIALILLCSKNMRTIYKWRNESFILSLLGTITMYIFIKLL